MSKSSIQEILKGIFSSLKTPKSINQISEETGYDRVSVSKYLSVLTDCGILDEKREGRSKVFSIKRNLSWREDTYFGLPLTRKAEKEAYSLFNLIRKKWSEKTNDPLLMTHVQKIMYKVIVDCNLSIPKGWYVYGGIGVVAFNNNRQYGYYGFDNEKKVEDCVSKAVQKYARLPAWKVKQIQYKNAHKPLYDAKENIYSILYSKNFDEHAINSLRMIVTILGRILSYAPREYLNEYIELINTYKELMTDLTYIDKTKLIQHKRGITELFDAIWKYIALFNFKRDLKEYYSDEILDVHFRFDIIRIEEEIIELGTMLQSLIPKKPIKDPLKKELYQALDRIRPLTDDEKLKKTKELENKKKELGEDKYQDWLIQQVGL